MVKSVILFMLSGAVISHLQARPLPDPTRPPEVLQVLPDGKLAKTTVEPILQSVLISPSRKIAVINGQIVVLNGVFGEFRLVSINPASVLLKNEKSEKTLFLLSPEERQFANARFIKKIPEQVQQK